MLFIYKFSSYEFGETFTGRIYSPRNLLRNNELYSLITKAIKVLGEVEAEDIEEVCKLINEWLGMEPATRNITELVDFEYLFINENNCGGYFKNKKLYNWIDDDEVSFKSKRFFTWYESNTTQKRMYVPCKFALNRRML